MNLATVLVTAVLAVIVILDIRYLMRNGIDSCGGDCSSCGPSCRWADDIEKARRQIRFRRRIRKFFHLS